MNKATMEIQSENTFEVWVEEMIGSEIAGILVSRGGEGYEKDHDLLFAATVRFPSDNRSTQKAAYYQIANWMGFQVGSLGLTGEGEKMGLLVWFVTGQVMIGLVDRDFRPSHASELPAANKFEN